MPLVAIQVLDGVSATVFGLMMPLIAADLTRRTGYLNLAIGSLALAAGWAPPSAPPSPAGSPTRSGPPAAFFGLALVGLAALWPCCGADAGDAARQATARAAVRPA